MTIWKWKNKDVQMKNIYIYIFQPFFSIDNSLTTGTLNRDTLATCAVDRTSFRWDLTTTLIAFAQYIS